MSDRVSQRPPAQPVVSNDSGDDFTGTERFEIVRRLGAGGMGVVYEAYDRERDARVALKTLRTLKPDALLRFKNEFRALQDISHPNLVALGELFEEEGRWFFTMEMVDGAHFLDYVTRADEPDDAPSISVKSAALSTSGVESAVSVSADTRAVPETVRNARTEDRPTIDLPTGASEPPPAPRPMRQLGSGVDVRRLRSALAQLALGLAALHRAQKVHRDIKPSNILVTREGQVKILDFGLVADLLNAYPESHLVGTYSYMAPEQAGLRPVGPAADWYSVGVLIYKAITGRLPVTGNAREVLVLKQAFEPAPPSAIAEVPEDLDKLCVDLLHIDPAARPSGREILERLGAREAAHGGGGPLPHFIGRRMEIDALHKAFAVTRKTRGVTFFVHGESGVGKSALVRRFTDAVASEMPDAVVFFGRCYERENVPYKGVDGIIDALSRHLATLEPAALGPLLPRQKGLIGQVFPVMRRIEAIAQAPKPAPGALDPQILRARLFFALRELFTRLAEQGPLVLVIDDLQWADADSLALLAEIMRPPDAPKLLLLATMRAGNARASIPDAEVVAAAGRKVADVAALFGGDVRQIHIESLPRGEAQALVAALLRDAGTDLPADSRSVETIAAAAAGHPLFIDELVRRRLTVGAEAGPLKLDEALWARVEALEPGARRVLELVAVAGVPLAQRTAALAAKIDFNELVRRVSILRGANLVRTAGVRRSDTVEPYHDRVREAVLLHIDAEAKSRSHARLAFALEAEEHADPEALATHWQGAGAADKARVYVLRAAAQAEEALAFDRAARLYQRALDLEPATGAEATRLHARLGDALAHAGRGAEAARAYLEAAQSAQPVEALTLRRRGAEELLRSGHVDEAFAEFATVLAAVDLELPETPQRALMSLLYRRARVRLRGLDFEPRDERQIPIDVLQRIDVCWAVTPALGMIDIIRGSDFQARNLLLALEAGEPYRVARALAAEACAAATEGGRGRERTDKLLAAAAAAAKSFDDPYTQGWLELANVFATYLDGRWRACHDACVRAEKAFSRCVGAWWELGTAQLYATLSLFWLGDVAAQWVRAERTLRQGKERGDLSTVVNACAGFCGLPWLAHDEPAVVRREIDESMGRWSRRGFLLAHYWEVIGRAHIAMYEGDGPGAYALVTQRWPALARSLLQRCQLILVESHFLRGRVALAHAATLGAASPERGRLTREAEEDAQTIEAEHMAYATPLGWLLRAGAHALRGEDAAAARLYGSAARAFVTNEMALFSAVARRRHGELVGGEAGIAEIAEADAWMATQEIARPDRITAVLAPARDPRPGAATKKETAPHVAR
jgi:serine/threonine protein kinase/tetratricopeptide (TPR) repeat protein